MTAAIKQLFAAHHGTYGSPRITDDLREAGWRVSEKNVAKIMREQRLAARAKKRRKHTTRQGKRRWRPPDLIGRDFPASRLNQKWYGDGTEIPTDEGKLYLDTVLDVGSRRAVGFAMDDHHDAELAHAALAMAVAVRGGKDAVAGVIMHTDQGSEYTAKIFRAACARMGITQSMGRVGSALDNAVIESWHSTLEFELRGRSASPPKRTPAPGSRPGSTNTTGSASTPAAACAARSTTRSPCTPPNSTIGQQRHEQPEQDPLRPKMIAPSSRRQGQALPVACGQP